MVIYDCSAGYRPVSSNSRKCGSYRSADCFYNADSAEEIRNQSESLPGKTDGVCVSYEFEEIPLVGFGKTGMHQKPKSYDLTAKIFLYQMLREIKRIWNRINRNTVSRRIFISLIAVNMLIAGASNKRLSTSCAETSPEPTAAVQSIDRRAVLAAETAYKTSAVTEDVDPQAAAIAKVLYGTARNNSSDDQRLCVWCILNRVEHPNYPGTVESVCSQKSQWMGYSDDNPVVRDLYDLALSELTTWRESGIRPVGPEYIFMSWTANKIVLRTTFEETANTRYQN